MPEYFDKERLVQEFDDYLEKGRKHLVFLIEEIGLAGVNDLSFFVGTGYSSEREAGYYNLQYQERLHKEAKKFNDDYFFKALEIILDEFELYSGECIEWVRNALNTRLLNKNFEKNYSNKIYGCLVRELVEQGASQKNAIEFVAAVTGIAGTVIRDAFYEANRMKKRFNLSILGSHQFEILEKYLSQNAEKFAEIAKNPKFDKSRKALEKYKQYIKVIRERRKLGFRESVNAMREAGLIPKQKELSDA